MLTPSYQQRRGQLETYFDRTALEAWKRLTSDAPVGRVRQTVRAGRERMRATLLEWLPDDLSGTRLLDAGCGTGALAVEAARRGAEVTAVDLSPKLVALARERAPTDLGSGSLRFCVADFLEADLGCFEHVVAMDSLIHYRSDDVLRTLESLVTRCCNSILFTFAPRTVPLALMHAVGRLVPHRSHRAPAIEPLAEAALRRDVATSVDLRDWQVGRTERVASGFYTSQALELVGR